MDVAAADATRGVAPPAFILRSVETAARSFARMDPESHTLCAHYDSRLTAISDLNTEDAKKLRARCLEILSTEVYPAYTRFADAVIALLPKASPGAGVGYLPNGEEIYRLALDAWGADGLSADRVHALGLAEVERIHDEMDLLLDTLGYVEGTVGERMQRLAADPKHADAEHRCPTSESNRSASRRH